EVIGHATAVGAEQGRVDVGVRGGEIQGPGDDELAIGIDGDGGVVLVLAVAGHEDAAANLVSGGIEDLRVDVVQGADGFLPGDHRSASGRGGDGGVVGRG